MRIVECRSPNHDARAKDARIDMLVLHYTGMKTADEALARLTDPAAKVSAHYTIGRDGRIFRHMDEERRAWHAGVSYWAGERDVNSRSIGIELVNPGHEFGYEPFPREQIGALLDLADGIVARHAIPPWRVLGHSDVAPARKTDPGELFPWPEIAQFGVGIWPEGFSSPRAGWGKASDESFVEALSRFGYGVAPAVDISLTTVVAAFQRHFRPKKIDGIVDAETRMRILSLIAAVAR